mmetsp:Transcript_35661/g.75138  ORF Transcript_35661/g.75138 Transcript_35661/m.75138 type:complete len:344 (-) Transcript_35661:51-1082(-)
MGACRCAESKIDSTPDLLCQDYERMVNCLLQCEFMIKTLQEQVASKDEQLASMAEYNTHINTQQETSLKALREQLASKDEQLHSKDQQIASLEERLVKMSLELASTKAREDKLEHQLRRSNSSDESNLEDESCHSIQETPSLGVMLKAFDDAGAIYPRDSISQTRCRGGHVRSLSLIIPASKRLSDGGDADIPNNAKYQFKGSSASKDNHVASSFRKMLGNMNLSIKKGLSKELQAPLPQDVLNEENTPVMDPTTEDDDDTSSTSPIRGDKTTKLPISKVKSSHSFIDGVVFPITSYDVLNKGCRVATRNGSHLARNDSWSRVQLVKKPMKHRKVFRDLLKES